MLFDVFHAWVSGAEPVGSRAKISHDIVSVGSLEKKTLHRGRGRSRGRVTEGNAGQTFAFGNVCWVCVTHVFFAYANPSYASWR